MENPAVPKKMMIPRCALCRKKTVLYIECTLCHSKFCVRDQTPEAHHCPHIDKFKLDRIQLDQVIPKKIDVI